MVTIAMTRMQKKVLLAVFITLGLWRLFEVPAVSSAFWTFCTIGVLPGTNRTVSPEVVLKFLIMAFPLCLLLIFRKEVLAAAPWRRQASAFFAAPVPVAAAAPKRAAKSPVVIVLPVKARTPFRVRLAKLDRALGAVMDAEVRFIVKAAALSWRAARRAARDLWAATLLAGHYILVAAVFTGRLLMRFWRFIEPSIRKFDHWLEVTLNQSRVISSALDVGGDLVRFTNSALQKAYAHAHRYIQRS